MSASASPVQRAADPAAPIWPVLLAGSAILLLSFGLRAGFGVFQTPIAAEMNWPRSEFSFALAIQNLVWGLAQPLFSMAADRYGDRKALTAGALFYALGLWLSSTAMTPGEQALGAGLLVGLGVAGTGFGVVLAVVGRIAPPEKRSQILGLVTAAGSLGQVVVPPLAEWLQRATDWRVTLAIFAGLALLMLLLTPFVKGPPKVADAQEEPMGQVLGRAFRDPTYWLLFIGFFSCGYQLAFITAHFPAFVTEICGPILGEGAAALGAQAIAVIGVMNVVGTILAGRLGAKYSKKYLLAGIYAARTIVGAWFIMTPMTPTTVLIFSALMGSLWLATVPLTSGIVADLYGLKYMGTLYGVIFLSHQLGGFMGVWLGGAFYDAYGSYTLVWWVGVGVGALSAIVHLPIRETPPPSRGGQGGLAPA
ncbi:MFS transporter [Neomegalonema perideroedes]|uniref:MFS transporter n=1 Tax=Neomegalonema perideroedes TaxID=217219 RepID=UPI00035D23B6|nr:MFS transporter [Neomegalonema perideroedes]